MHEELLKELIDLKNLLLADNYKDWSYAIITIDKAIQQLQNLNTPAVSVRSEQSNCVHSYEHILTVKTLKYRCKKCGDEKWEQLD